MKILCKNSWVFENKHFSFSTHICLVWSRWRSSGAGGYRPARRRLVRAPAGAWWRRTDAPPDSSRPTPPPATQWDTTPILKSQRAVRWEEPLAGTCRGSGTDCSPCASPGRKGDGRRRWHRLRRAPGRPWRQTGRCRRPRRSRCRWPGRWGCWATRSGTRRGRPGGPTHRASKLVWPSPRPLRDMEELRSHPLWSNSKWDPGQLRVHTRSLGVSNLKKEKKSLEMH